ncbi:MAG: hypothetical protein QM692_13660 [Thermomicrobiales bacterium]
MDAARFDAVSRPVIARLTRRRLGLLAGAGALGAAVVAAGDAPDAAARKRRNRAGAEHNLRGNKAIMCVNGVTERVPKRKRKKLLKQGATRGECPPVVCTPVCAPGACGSDGCGGTCSCAAGSVCASGTCRSCTVSCPTGSTPAECGATLQTAIAGGGDIFVCPGRYRGGFVSNLPVSIYGAGNSDNPAVDTILDAQQTTTVMTASGAGTHAFVNLHITGGSGPGMLVLLVGVIANVTNCVITGNSAESGGGIAVGNGVVHIVGSSIVANTALSGGGIFLGTYGSSTITTTTISGNTATTGDGGGILQYNGTVTLDTTVSITGNTPDNCTGTGC